MESPQLPDPELLRELCAYRMPFGKYQGQLLLRLPEAYLAWFARKGMPSGKLGMMLETALVVRQNGLDELVRPLIDGRMATLLVVLSAFSACAPSQNKSNTAPVMETGAAHSVSDKKLSSAGSDDDSCNELARRICDEAGEKRPICVETKSTLSLLPAKSCVAALAEFPTVQARLIEKTADCTKVVEVLCAAVGPDTESCTLVKEKTPEFRGSKCREMLANTDKIAAQLKQMESRNANLANTTGDQED